MQPSAHQVSKKCLRRNRYPWTHQARDPLGRPLQVTSTATGAVTLYTTPLSWTAGYDNRNRLTQLNRAGAETTYTYDANSNRLSAIDKTTSDTDLDGEFDDSDFSKSTGQALNIDPASNKLLGFTQTFTKVRGTRNGLPKQGLDGKLPDMLRSLPWLSLWRLAVPHVQA